MITLALIIALYGATQVTVYKNITYEDNWGNGEGSYYCCDKEFEVMDLIKALNLDGIKFIDNKLVIEETRNWDERENGMKEKIK